MVSSSTSSLFVPYTAFFPFPKCNDLQIQAYQCAYPGGACTWLNQTGELQNTHQSNCPLIAPCPASGCGCPIDNNAHSGELINHFKCYQCAYPSGACAWDNVGSFYVRMYGYNSYLTQQDVGEVLDVFQTNCVRTAQCQA
jgi:hypothetical protein